MQRALQHSTYAAIHDLVARAMFLEAAVLLLFISEISPSDTRGKLSLVYCHCSCILFCSCILLNKMRIFERGNTSVPLRSDIKQCCGVTRAAYSRLAPLTRDPRCRPEIRDRRPALIRLSQDFLPCILDLSHVRVHCVRFFI